MHDNRPKRMLSQRNYLSWQRLRETNEHLRQLDRGIKYGHQTFTPDGRVLSVGGTIEAVKSGETWVA